MYDVLLKNLNILFKKNGKKNIQAPKSKDLLLTPPSLPQMNMLMRLQEAASYSSPQSNDSDSTSMDSAPDFTGSSSQGGANSRPAMSSSTAATTNSSVESTI